MVLDPTAPRAVLDALVAQLAPTVLVVDGERHAVPGGIPVPEGTAAVVVTSGTTAQPKGVELTYDGIAAIGHGWASAMGHEADDHWLVCVPLHHVAGLAILARASITGAAVTVRDDVRPRRRRGRARHDRSDARVGRADDARAPARRRCADARVPACRHWRRAAAHRPAEAGTDDGKVAVVDTYGQSETWGGCVANGVPIPGTRVRLGEQDEIEIAGAMVMPRLPA